MASNMDFGIEDLSDFKLVGSGGFAAVYSAHDSAFNRTVAVKVLLGREQSVNRSFERERSYMGQLSGHPNVITPYRHGFTNDGSLYLVMEYMAGGSLRDVVSKQGPLNVIDAVGKVAPIADALIHSHAQDILHKDVKPANILLSATGIPKLSDFGISRIRQNTATQIEFTLAHTPPETFIDGFDQRDERSDCYSLASTFFSTVTGKDAFAVKGQDSQGAYLRRIEQHDVPIVGVGYLDRFFAKAMAKNPDERYGNASELASALRALAEEAKTTDGGSPTISGVETAVAPVVVPHKQPPVANYATQTFGDQATGFGRELPPNQATTPSAPPETPPPATQPPAIQPPATQPPATQLPATQPPATGVPVPGSQLPYQVTATADPRFTPSAVAQQGHHPMIGRGSFPPPSQRVQSGEARSKAPVAIGATVLLLAIAAIGLLAWRSMAASSSDDEQNASSVVALSQQQTYESIFDVDFLNGQYFTHDSVGEITVQDGVFSNDSGFRFAVTDLSYGDLDADGSDEAFVSSMAETSNSPAIVGVNVFRLNSEGELERIPTDTIRPNANQARLGGWIDNGRVQIQHIEKLDTSEVVAARHSYQLNDTQLELTEIVIETLATTTEPANRVVFRPGTDRAILVAADNGSAVLDVASRQTIEVEALGGSLAGDEISIGVASSGETLARGFGQVATKVWERTDYTVNIEAQDSSDQELEGYRFFAVTVTR